MKIYICYTISIKQVQKTKGDKATTKTEFKLTEKDKKTLLEWGYLKEDLQQIEDGANIGTITFTYKHRRVEHEITPQKAIRIIGREQFLSGLSRAAFHWSAIEYVRDNDKNGFVYFHMDELFEG